MREVNLAALDLNLLVVLEQLLERQHVSRAAEALEMSQPGVSRALARLRLMFGDPLLVGKPMQLTARAESLREPLQRVLRGTRELLAPAHFDPAQARFTVRVHMLDYGSLLVLPGLLSQLRERAPGVELELPPRVTKPLEALRQGELDLLVGRYPTTRREFRHQLLFKDRFVCVVRRGLLRELTLASFCALEHVMITTTGAPGGPVDDALAARGLSRKLALRLPHFLAAALVVAETDLILTLPGRVAERLRAHAPLDVWEPPLDVPGFTVDLVWHARLQHDPAHRWVRQQVTRLAEPG